MDLNDNLTHSYYLIQKFYRTRMENNLRQTQSIRRNFLKPEEFANVNGKSYVNLTDSVLQTCKSLWSASEHD